MVAITAALIGVTVISLVVLPLIGWPRVVRVSPILLVIGALLLMSLRPWKWPERQWTLLGEWNPPRRVVGLAAVVLGAMVFWFVLSRFRSGDINAIDFSVYYDRPVFQT